MSNTYTQIHIQTVFPVKFRNGLIGKEWKHELYQYITGIVQNHRHKMLAINGTSDHLHMFFGMRPSQSVSDLMQQVKASSSEWINNRHFIAQRFEWQQGYGAFSYCNSEVETVINYIRNQEIHHGKVSFLEEYRSFLKKFEIQYEEQYLFKGPV